VTYDLAVANQCDLIMTVALVDISNVT
jgi:hypothetical protein